MTNVFYDLLIAYNGMTYYIAGPDDSILYAGSYDDCKRYIDNYVS